MSIWDHKEEIKRLLDSPKDTQVWLRTNNEENWILRKPEGLHWATGSFYIVDDKHAEIRKEWIDRGKPPVQIYDEAFGEWDDYIGEPDWDIHNDYRIKPMEWDKAIGKLVWVRESDSDRWSIAVLDEYDPTSRAPFKDSYSIWWKQAKLAEIKDLYKKETE